MKIVIDTPIGFSDLGERGLQEDAVRPLIDNLSSQDCLFVLCDGMGGHHRGEIASDTVANSIQHHYKENDIDASEESLRLLIEEAWGDLDDHYDDTVVDRQMGTTLACLLLSGFGYMAAHIGDSRIYHIRPAEITSIVYRSADHSQVGDLIAAGELSAIEALSYRNKNILNRAIMPRARYDIDIFCGSDIQAGDYFMLCSDGVTEYLTDEMLRFIFAPYRTAGEIMNLIHQHCQQLAKDNNTCIIIPVISVTEEDITTKLPNVEQELITEWKDDALLRESIAYYHTTDNKE